MTLTPLHLRILLHCYVSPPDVPYSHGIVIAEYQSHLIEMDLLQYKHPDHIIPTVTPRGKAHIQQLLSLPLPQQAWVGADGAVIQM